VPIDRDGLIDCFGIEIIAARRLGHADWLDRSVDLI
jgi:hypothetical protein